MHETITNVCHRTTQQLYRDRRIAYQNRVETNRQNLVLLAIEKEHHRKEVTYRTQKLRLLNDFKRNTSTFDNSFMLIKPNELTHVIELKDSHLSGARIHSTIPRVRSSVSEMHLNLNCSSRTKSAPFPTYHRQYSKQNSTDSNNTIVLDKPPTSAANNSTFTKHSPKRTNKISDRSISNLLVADHRRRTGRNRIKASTLQDEDEVRLQFPAGHNQQRKTKTFSDLRHKHQDRQSIQLNHLQSTEEYQSNGPVFTQCCRQLKFAMLTPRMLTYDPTDDDDEINTIIRKPKVERSRTAVLPARQIKLQHFYWQQQLFNNANLSKRIDDFLKRLNEFKREQEE